MIRVSRYGLVRKKKSALIADYLTVTGQQKPDDFCQRATRADLIAEINCLLDKDNDRAIREANAPKPKTADLCTFPAREINAWLRTLPREVPE